METEEIKFYELLRKLKQELFKREGNEYPTQFIENLRIVIE